MAGIGTLTYYDPATGQYGALGHGITDVDTAQLMPLASGSIMETTVKAVKKGRKGDPGELKGDFSVQRDVYQVEIVRLYGADEPTRNMLLRITDPRLLSATGGIVQGM